MSARSNKTGPIIFGGNTTLKKTEKVVEQSSEILSRPEFQKPLHKMKNVKDLDIEDEYSAWGWQEAEKQN